MGYNISLVPVKPPGIITGSHDCAAMLCLFMVVIVQAALDVVAPWYQGSAVSALVPSATVELMAQNKMEEDEDNKAEETDADVVKRDLVQVRKGKKKC